MFLFRGINKQVTVLALTLLPTLAFALPLTEENYTINFNANFPGNYRVSQDTSFGFDSSVNNFKQRFPSSSTLSFSLRTPQSVSIPTDSTLYWSESFKVTANTGYNLPLKVGDSFSFEGPFSGSVGQAVYSATDTAALNKDTKIHSANVNLQFSGAQSGSGKSISNGNIGSITLKLRFIDGGEKAEARFRETAFKNLSRTLKIASTFSDPATIVFSSILLVTGEVEGQLLDLINTNGSNIGSNINLGMQVRDFLIGFSPELRGSPWTQTLNAVSLAADFSSEYYRRVANDPPDTNFREVDSPKVIEINSIGNESDPNTIYRTNLINTSIEALELQDMILTSLERYQAAHENSILNPSESHFMDMQAEAVFMYTDLFRAKSSELENLMSELEGRLLLDGVNIRGVDNLIKVKAILTSNPSILPEIQELYLKYGKEVVDEAIARVLAYSSDDYNTILDQGFEYPYKLSSEYGLNNQRFFSTNLNLVNSLPISEPTNFEMLLIGIIILACGINSRRYLSNLSYQYSGNPPIINCS